MQRRKGKNNMPCGDTQTGDWERLENVELRKELLRVTKVACEILTAVRQHTDYYGPILAGFSDSTLQWVREHELVDKKRRNK